MDKADGLVTEEERARQLYDNLGEAVASCGGAIEEGQKSSMFGAKDLERLQAARLLLAIVRENFSKHNDWPPVAPRWMAHLGFERAYPLPQGLMVRDRAVFARPGSNPSKKKA